jgi:hypothetical protein
LARDLEDDDEAAIEHAWKVSGDLHVITDRLAMCRMRNEPPPAWVHEAFLELADASVDIESYAPEARDLVRYIAVREAHDHGKGKVSWEQAKVLAAEKLRGCPAEAEPEYLWNVYKRIRKAMRAARPNLRDDDPGYRTFDELPDKS